MNTPNPVYTQAISVASIIAVVKALLAVMLAFRVFRFDEVQRNTVDVLIDTALPIVAVFAGAWWASRKVTPLAAPRDSDGATLSRPDNSPAIAESAKIEGDHDKALEINAQIDRLQDERRINR